MWICFTESAGCTTFISVKYLEFNIHSIRNAVRLGLKQANKSIYQVYLFNNIVVDKNSWKESITK